MKYNVTEYHCMCLGHDISVRQAEYPFDICTPETSLVRHSKFSMQTNIYHKNSNYRPGIY